MPKHHVTTSAPLGNRVILSKLRRLSEASVYATHVVIIVSRNWHRPAPQVCSVVVEPAAHMQLGTWDPAAGPGTCWDGVRERVCELTSLPLHHQAYTRCSGLARRCAPALPCLAVFLGAGELPRRLVFSCVCAGMVPVAPAVGAVLVCACGPGGRRCGLMCVWYLR